jgi:hypothetical protein
MSLANPYSAGLRNVGSYQVAGQPYMTGSNIIDAVNVINSGAEKQILFPYVTKSITLWNHSAGVQKLRFHLVTSSSITNHPASRHYYELATNESLSINLKCKTVWLSAVGGDVQWKLYASLTNISTGSMYDLTGSGISS